MDVIVVISRIIALFLLMAVGLLLVAVRAEAVVTIVGTFPIQQLLLVVGSTGARVDTVSMDVPGADVGNAGRPVVGSPTVRILVLARAPAGTPNFELVVDSSTPLSDGAGGTIPMTEIGWTSADGSVANGRFAGTIDQLLMTAPPDRFIRDTLTFQYRNSTVPPAGSYQGRVRFTLSVP